MSNTESLNKRVSIVSTAALALFFLGGCGGSGSHSDTPHSTTIQGELKPGDARFGTEGQYVVFYSCHVRQDGVGIITLHGSTFPPLLRVGAPVPNNLIQEIGSYYGSADDSASPTPATTTLEFVGGATYYVAATTSGGEAAGSVPTGKFTLEFSDIFDNVHQDDTIQANTRGAVGASTLGRLVR